MHTNRSDADLLDMLRVGDESAFVALYRRRQPGIYRFALRMSGSASIAEDVTQEVFMHLMHGNGNFDATRGSIQSYLFGIARNQVLRRIERERGFFPIAQDDETDSRAAEILTAPHNPLVDLTRRETIESVRQAVLALPAHYREVVVLCDLHEMSYLEAAEVLGCAIGTVRSRLHRARTILVEKLRALNANAEVEVEVQTTEPAQCFV